MSSFSSIGSLVLSSMYTGRTITINVVRETKTLFICEYLLSNGNISEYRIRKADGHVQNLSHEMVTIKSSLNTLKESLVPATTATETTEEDTSTITPVIESPTFTPSRFVPNSYYTLGNGALLRCVTATTETVNFHAILQMERLNPSTGIFEVEEMPEHIYEGAVLIPKEVESAANEVMRLGIAILYIRTNNDTRGLELPYKTLPMGRMIDIIADIANLLDVYNQLAPSIDTLLDTVATTPRNKLMETISAITALDNERKSIISCLELECNFSF